MKKHIVILALLLLALTAGAYAQTHWISLEAKAVGAGLRYELVLTPKFTVGAFVSYSFLTIPLFDTDNFEIGANARFYPTGRKFFLDISLGYGSTTGEFSPKSNDGNYYGNNRVYEKREGFSVAPGIGWTIDVGKAGAFFISPGLKLPFIFGDGFYYASIAPYFGIGYAF